MSALIPSFITGGGFAGLIVLLLVTGQLHTRSAMEAKDKIIDAKDRQIEKLENALVMERTRSDTVVTTAGIVRDVMESLRKEAQ